MCLTVSFVERRFDGRKTSFDEQYLLTAREGNIFTSVCHSVHGGGGRLMSRPVSGPMVHLGGGVVHPMVHPGGVIHP